MSMWSPVSSRSRRAALLWITGAVGYLILEALTAAAYPRPYSYADHYISDLGVSGPRSHLMHAAFFLQGTMFVLAAMSLVGRPTSARARGFVGLAGVNALGNIVVGALHSGQVHVLGAALAIVGGNAAILAGHAVVEPVASRRWYRNVSKLIAGLGLLCLTVLVVGGSAVQPLPAGALERGSVYSILLWQLLTGVCLLLDRQSECR